jgi:hypothetical protein
MKSVSRPASDENKTEHEESVMEKAFESFVVQGNKALS